MRLLRTNSSKTTFEETLMKFKQHLRTRSYPKTVTERSLSHVLFVFYFLFILQPLSFFPRREITFCVVVWTT